MDAAFESALIDCLDALERGETIAVILARNPQYEAEFKPILEMAQSLAGVRVAHSLEAQANSRQDLLTQADALRAATQKPPVFAGVFRRMATVLVPLVIVFAFIAASVVFASDDALPGDALYNTKRVVENARAALTSDPLVREALRKQFDDERIVEIQALLDSNRRAEVTFGGVIEQVSDSVWVVAGLHVSIIDSTIIDGTPMVGRYAWVSGKTLDGQLTAESIKIEFVPDTVPLPSSDEESEATPTIARQFRGSDVPTPTETAAPTETLIPNSTPEPTGVIPITATETPEPEPPAAAADDGNDNEGGDSNADENENTSGDDNDSGNENDHEEDNENDTEDENDIDDENENDNENENENENENDNDDENENDDDHENENSGGNDNS